MEVFFDIFLQLRIADIHMEWIASWITVIYTNEKLNIMAEGIKELYLRSLPEPITLKATEKIIDQMNNDICRIYNNNRNGFGFFVKIPYKKNILPVLITSNHVINIDDILNNSIISIYINNDKKIKTIKLDNNRKKYTNEKYDITIIEIKKMK